MGMEIQARRPIISLPGDRAFLLSQAMRYKRDCLRAPSVTHELRRIHLAVPTCRPHGHWPTVAISRSSALDCTSASLVLHIAVVHALIRAPAGPLYYLTAVVLLLILPHVKLYSQRCTCSPRRTVRRLLVHMDPRNTTNGPHSYVASA